jgi:hypothetical protein
VSRRTRNFRILWLLFAGLAAGEASGQAHGPPAQELRIEVDRNDPAYRAERLAEMDVWLRRLTGLFYNESNPVDHDDKRMDCIGIGTGAGVQCFTTLGSGSISAVRYARGDSPQTEAKLFGIDPVALKVNYLQVNSKGLPEGGLGKVSGDTFTLRFECKIPDDADKIISCEYRLRIYAPPDSNELTVSTETTMRIRTERGIQEVSNEATSFLKRIPDPGSVSAAIAQKSRRE